MTWSGLCFCCAIFPWRVFQSSNHLFDQACALENKLKQAEEAPLPKIHWIAANCSCSGPVAVLYLPHVWIPQMYIVYRQKWSDIYLSLYGTCTYLHLIIVFLQQCCMSGTSEVHCGGLSLKRSARGAGWVVCVCANVWSLLESIGHVLIYVDEGAMDWFRAWVTSSQETRELHRDLEERSKTQALSLFWACSCPKQISRWL